MIYCWAIYYHVWPIAQQRFFVFSPLFRTRFEYMFNWYFEWTFFIAHFVIKKMKKDVLGGESVEVFIVKENLPLLKISTLSMVPFIYSFFKFANRVNLLELVHSIIPLFNPTRTGEGGQTTPLDCSLTCSKGCPKFLFLSRSL